MASMLRKATPKPTASKSPSAAQIKKAEAAFKKMIQSGKVKNLASARAEIKKKYGVRPNGMTN